jgi:RAT1-interacting protein
MYGTVRNDKIYVEEERLPQDNNPKSKLHTYWGHKFENLCLVDHRLPAELVPPLSVRREESVNTNEEFGIVLKIRLGSHRFVIGAEVDGIDEQTNEYIELKTSKTPSSQFDERFFKEKLMKYWLQSYLAGIPKVLVGFRDKKGFVRSLEYYKVSEMPRLVRGHVRWDPNAILLMGDQFFTWLNNQIASDKTVHGNEFSFQLRHSLNGAGLIEYNTTAEVAAELPDWYKYY